MAQANQSHPIWHAKVWSKREVPPSPTGSLDRESWALSRRLNSIPTPWCWTSYHQERENLSIMSAAQSRSRPRWPVGWRRSSKTLSTHTAQKAKREHSHREATITQAQGREALQPQARKPNHQGSRTRRTWGPSSTRMLLDERNGDKWEDTDLVTLTS